MRASATLDIWHALLRVYTTVRIWPARHEQYAEGRRWIRLQSLAQVAARLTDEVATGEAATAVQVDDTSSRSSSPLYHYCIIRPDLPRGTEGSQIGHAYARSNHMGSDLPENTHNVVLRSCKKSTCMCNGSHLLELEQYLITNAIRHIAIREPDAPWYNSIMAIGIYPALKPEIGHHFRHLKCIS